MNHQSSDSVGKVRLGKVGQVFTMDTLLMNHQSSDLVGKVRLGKVGKVFTMDTLLMMHLMIGPETPAG
jgi:hypothetical protein